MQSSVQAQNTLTHIPENLRGALGASIAVISVRRLSQTESAQTLLVYQAVFVGILAGIPLFWLWKTPDLGWTLFLLATGVAAAIGQWSGIESLRLGEASVIGNIQYLGLIYAAILGFFLFDEVPELHTITGASIIIGASIYLLHREALAKRGKRD